MFNLIRGDAFLPPTSSLSCIYIGIKPIIFLQNRKHNSSLLSQLHVSPIMLKQGGTIIPTGNKESSSKTLNRTLKQEMLF